MSLVHDGSPVGDELLIMHARPRKRCVTTGLPLSLSNDIRYIGQGEFVGLDFCQPLGFSPDESFRKRRTLHAELKRLKDEAYDLGRKISDLEFEKCDIEREIDDLRDQLEQLP